jgi:hypothetical protein
MERLPTRRFHFGAQTASDFLSYLARIIIVSRDSAQHVDRCAFLLLNWVVNKVNSRCAIRSTMHPTESSSV